MGLRKLRQRWSIVREAWDQTMAVATLPSLRPPRHQHLTLHRWLAKWKNLNPRYASADKVEMIIWCVQAYGLVAEMKKIDKRKRKRDGCRDDEGKMGREKCQTARNAHMTRWPLKITHLTDGRCNDPPPMTQYCPLLAPHIRLPRRSPILGLLSQRLA
jgi:hypothetical protein